MDCVSNVAENKDPNKIQLHTEGKVVVIKIDLHCKAQDPSMDSKCQVIEADSWRRTQRMASSILLSHNLSKETNS